MKLSEIAEAIAELPPSDAAYILIQAIIRVGEHGRPAGDTLKGQVEGLSEGDKVHFDEGLAWVEDELSA